MASNVRRILVCGLPGSGKTTLARRLAKALGAAHFNGDAVREQADDWDFSERGRLRQAQRMRRLCDSRIIGLTVADFVCPTDTLRAEFGPHYTVFMDTIKESRHTDTDEIFLPPLRPDFRVTMAHDDMVRALGRLADNIRQGVRATMPQGTMIGRYQPWHDGHKALFLEVLKKHGYVGIGVRQMPQEARDDNPYDFDEVSRRIVDSLQAYRHCFHVYRVPNIAGLYWGRDVGYETGRISLPPDIEAISATAIRCNAEPLDE